MPPCPDQRATGSRFGDLDIHWTGAASCDDNERWWMGALPPGAGSRSTRNRPVRTRLAPVPVPSGNPVPAGARRPPTIEDVARAAGVGRGTASRVLNGSVQVSPAARAAVSRAVDEARLRSQPGGTLTRDATDRHRRTRRIGAGDRLFEDPYFAAILRGIGERLAESPYQAPADDDRDIARP